MKPKQSSPLKDEPGIIDFTCRVKPKKGVTGNIGDEDSSVKLGLNDMMTYVFESLKEGLPKLAKLQRKAMEVRSE